ncbi:unannotated protein [freshwater metagenome]|uniref:Unannotated protein n=1 Tax=freshwater metagenome TaxID=449393 RepID=A0A6J6SUW2_9ZZZZ
MPLVAATATVRPVSIARIRSMNNCCIGWAVPAYVALFVWTVTMRAPPLMMPATTSS